MIAYIYFFTGEFTVLRQYEKSDSTDKTFFSAVEQLLEMEGAFSASVREYPSGDLIRTYIVDPVEGVTLLTGVL